MPEHTVTLVINRVVGTMITEDGKHMLMMVEDPNGNRIEIAVATDALPGLISGSALEQENAVKVNGQAEVPAFGTPWFEFGEDANNPQQKVLAMKFENGGKIRYALPAGMDGNMCDVLQVMTGRGSAAAPGETVN